MKKLLERKTKYNKLYVLQDDSVRRLNFRIGMAEQQGEIDINDLRSHLCDFTLLLMYSTLFVPQVSKVLAGGLGTGVVPREILHYFPDAYVDIVEIDNDVINVAQDLFYFAPTERTKIYCNDLLSAIPELDGGYDIIFLDAFTHSYIPYHLMTADFLEKIRDLLAPNGIVAANLFNIHPSFPRQIKTYLSVFNGDIYELIGDRNNATTVIYAGKDGIAPRYEAKLPNDYYPVKVPQKIKITDTIKNAEVFAMKNV